MQCTFMRSNKKIAQCTSDVSAALIRRCNELSFFLCPGVELFFFFSLDVLKAKSVNERARAKEAQLERALMPDMQQETEEWVSFIEADGKFNQTHGDAFSNVWEYLHCLNCELYFNGVPRQRYTNTTSKRFPEFICYLTIKVSRLQRLWLFAVALAALGGGLLT